MNSSTVGASQPGACEVGSGVWISSRYFIGGSFARVAVRGDDERRGAESTGVADYFALPSPGMAEFVPGQVLCAAFYAEVVAPLLDGMPHAAALWGTGSDVLGYDTVQSTDHGWGPHAAGVRG